MLKIILLLTFILSGCIFPPTRENPRYISKDELVLISQLKQGKDLAKANQFQKAEEIYLELIKKGYEKSVVFNDYGYALYSQQRFAEATVLFYRSLKQEPLNGVARYNLAKALFKLEDYANSWFQLKYLDEHSEKIKLIGESSKISYESLKTRLDEAYLQFNYINGDISGLTCQLVEQKLERGVALLLSLDRIDQAKDILIADLTNEQSLQLLKVILFYSLGRYQESLDINKNLTELTTIDEAQKQLLRSLRALAIAKINGKVSNELIRKDLVCNYNLNFLNLGLTTRVYRDLELFKKNVCES